MALLDWIIGRRTLENPSTPLSSPDAWLYDALGAEKSAAGVRINANTALTISAWWRGINLVTGDVGKLPLCAFRRIAGGKNKEAAQEHPAYKLAKRPNQEMTSIVFKRTLQGHAMSEGNGYGYIRRAPSAEPLEVLPLNPNKTYPVRVGGVLGYVYTPNTDDPAVLESPKALLEEGRRIAASNMLHIKGLGFDGIQGYSVIQKSRDTLGRSKATGLYGARYFKNSARPSVIIEHPGKISPQAAANVRTSWNRLHEGIDNAHRTAVLEEGMKLSSFQINARDSQLIESEQHSLIEVANYLGLPPHKVGHPARTAFASLEQENKSYLDEALMPWLITWEEEWEAKLLTEQEKEDDSVTVEFIKQALLMGDMQARSAFYATALQNGWMNRDEVRALENMNPIPDGEGEKFFIPTNMSLSGEEPEEEPDEPEEPSPEVEPEEEDDRALRTVHADLLARSVGRIVRRVGENAKRMSKRPDAFGRWLDALPDEHLTVAADEFDVPLKAIRLTAGTTQTGREVAENLLTELREKLLDVSGRYTVDTLPGGVESFLASYEAGRPREIALSLCGGSSHASC